MGTFREIHVPALPFDPFVDLIGVERVRRFRAAGEAVADVLEGRTVWNVTSDAAVTGVAELVASLLPYVAGLGVEVRWLVLDVDAEVRRVVWRTRQGLQGFAGDDGPLGAEERDMVATALAPAASGLADILRPGDLVLLHDPAPGALVECALGARGIPVWRCHCTADSENDYVLRGWEFLRPFVERAPGFVFSRRAYTPPWLPTTRMSVIPPSVDPFRPKNRVLDAQKVIDVLCAAGIVAGTVREPPTFLRGDGTTDRLMVRARMLSEDGPPPASAPLVVQVTRWDPLKDMAGVLRGFAHHVTHPDAHLVLAGPDVGDVAADPAAGAVYGGCEALWRALPPARRSRVHLAQIPIDDPDASATVVNALQRHASVIAQKCLAADHSTAVAEAMLKGRPIVASGVGGIRDQIRDGVTGLLVEDPTDLVAFGAAVDRLLVDEALSRRLRADAYLHAVDRFLADRHLVQWGALVTRVLED